MIVDAGKENPHGVGAIVEVGDAGPVQIAGQLVDVRLQLCKGCKKDTSSHIEHQVMRANIRELFNGERDDGKDIRTWQIYVFFTNAVENLLMLQKLHCLQYFLVVLGEKLA